MLFGEELRVQTLVEFDRTGLETERAILWEVLDCTSHHGLMAFDLRDLFDLRRLLKRAALIKQLELHRRHIALSKPGRDLRKRKAPAGRSGQLVFHHCLTVF